MLQLKDLRGRSVGDKVTGWDGKILKKLEGPRGGGAWFAGTEESCRLNETIIAYWYRMSMITYKWFGCCGIAASAFEWAAENRSGDSIAGAKELKPCRSAVPRR